jgi:hypothetical protein
VVAALEALLAAEEDDQALVARQLLREGHARERHALPVAAPVITWSYWSNESIPAGSMSCTPAASSQRAHESQGQRPTDRAG